MRMASDCSASSPGLVVLAPTEMPALAPPGPLDALKPNARLASASREVSAPSRPPDQRTSTHTNSAR